MKRAVALAGRVFLDAARRVESRRGDLPEGLFSTTELAHSQASGVGPGPTDRALPDLAESSGRPEPFVTDA